jgi:phage I-like protein
MTQDILQLALTALPEGQDLPTELPLFRFGENKTRKGVFVFDEESAQSVMAAYAEHGVTELPFDWDHGMLDSSARDPKRAGEAAAWFKPEVRSDGLWASNIRFTDDATAAIKAKKWRFYSPAALRNGNKITRLINVALTNLPATDDMKPLVNKDSVEASEQSATIDSSRQESDSHMKDTLVLALGLGAGAAEADVLKSVAQFKDAFGEVLALTSKQSFAEAIGTIQGWKASADRLPSLESELVSLKQAQTETERDALIDSNKAKFSPSMRDWAKGQSLETLKAFVAVAPDLVSLNQPAVQQPAVDELTAVERKAAASLGVSEDEFKAARAARKVGA